MRIAPLLAAAALVAAAFPAAVLPLRAAPAPPDETQRKPAPRASATPAPDTEGVQFRALGPAAAGGRVTAVAGSDRDPQLYYVGGAGGGVFKSDDGGISFRPVWNGPTYGAIGALAVAPSDPQTVWAGTGEANPRNDVSWGDGVYLSRDGAKTWRQVGLADTSHVARILVDPRDPRVALVAALGDPWKDSPARGVYRTTDGGRHWSKTLYAGPASGAIDLAWNPRRPENVFAAIWQFRRTPWSASSGGPVDGLYRSRDGGRSWAKVTGHGFPGGLLGRIGIALAPSDPRRVYAVVQSKAGTIWRSDDGGDTWRKTSDSTLPEQRPFYFSRLAVDPTNENRVVSLSMLMTVSKDGGRTWKHLADNLHPDQHALWWSRDGKRMIEGNDGGVVLSNDGGAAWAFLDRIPLAQIYHVGFDLGKPYTLCGGLQDNYGWCAPTTGRNGTGLTNRDWYSVVGGDGMFVQPDPLDPALIWADAQDGWLSIYDSRARQSIDVTPYPHDPFGSATSLAESPYRFNWNSPLAFSPQDGHVAYFGGNVVFETRDRGRHWAPISPDLTRNEKAHQQLSGGPITLDLSGAETYDTLLALAPSPKEAGVIWTGSDDGLVQLTRDGGAHWRDVTPAGWPKYGRVEVVEPSPHAPGTAFALLDRHELGDRAPYVAVSDDYGASWRSIAANLPHDAPVRVIRQDPREPNLLYAGTETGLWLSYDRGGRWERLRAGLPTVAVYDVRVQPSENDLLVATHGRGFYVLDDLAPLQGLAAARRDRTAFFSVREATLWPSWPSDEGATPADRVFAPNAPSGAVLTFYQRDKARERPWFEIVDANGRVVRTLRGQTPFDPADPPKTERAKYYVGNEPGLNRATWDGTEEGPVRWRGTSFQNAGPTSGPEALPGSYTARLHRDGQVFEQRFTLADDPRSPWSAAQRAERHAYLATVYGWLDGLDRALNALDVRARGASPAERARLAALRDELTSDPRNDEDQLTKTSRVRERVWGLTWNTSGSLQPPFAQHAAALDALRPQVERALRDAAALLGPEYGPRG